MTLDLLPKPKRFLIFGRWILIKECSCDVGCSGHIVPFSIFKKINIPEALIDIEQWMIVREKELSAYEALVNPSNANVVEEGMATGALVQEIDQPQPQPEEVSNYNNSSPRKEKKPYMGKKKPRLDVKIFGK